jgi:hypothetical protein
VVDRRSSGNSCRGRRGPFAAILADRGARGGGGKVVGRMFPSGWGRLFRAESGRLFRAG